MLFKWYIFRWTFQRTNVFDNFDWTFSSTLKKKNHKNLLMQNCFAINSSLTWNWEWTYAGSTDQNVAALPNTIEFDFVWYKFSQCIFEIAHIFSARWNDIWIKFSIIFFISKPIKIKFVDYYICFIEISQFVDSTEINSVMKTLFTVCCVVFPILHMVQHHQFQEKELLMDELIDTMFQSNVKHVRRFAIHENIVHQHSHVAIDSMDDWLCVAKHWHRYKNNHSLVAETI